MGDREAPRDVAEAVERATGLPAGERERFSGYGVIGLPFASGHVLGMRRFPLSSVGPGYTSVWHRAPDGSWEFWSTATPGLSCARYAGAVSAESRRSDLRIDWPQPDRLRITSEDPDLDWEMVVGATRLSSALTAVARRLPRRFLDRGAVLSLLGPAAGTLLHTGPLALTGRMPNGQTFRLVPEYVWPLTDGRARLRGADLGPPGPLPRQAALGGFRIPQRGLLAAGSVSFDALDPARHSTRTVRA
ncbi:hypothetical protein ITI46_02640 [Streptomyces oryzae]|uniref:Uncharacterized protein n=1 Tax=Streptomyces oryzae TaxID=1434886 RepID=A0ABS3X696_9ACTN|nr:hypothetical protein [Streptomyces oryzae]MBO8190611.1 hypothetical protein [Streptomyces oryzae]